MNKLPKVNKNLGQHFLNDLETIRKITHNFHEEAEAIIEVGPGPAILTEHLASFKKPLILIEKDTRFLEYFTPLVPEENIIFTDALEINLQSTLQEKGFENKKVWFVSNLPYNISAPLTLKFLRNPQIQWMTLMYQKEVAEKILPTQTKKSKPMNSLAAICQNYFNVELLSHVPPGAFTPPPKVDSRVLSFTRKESPIISLEEFQKYEKFLRGTFQFRRKQLGKVLLSHYSKEKLDDALEKHGLQRTIRAEALNLEQLQLLYLSISS